MAFVTLEILGTLQTRALQAFTSLLFILVSKHITILKISQFRFRKIRNFALFTFSAASADRIRVQIFKRHFLQFLAQNQKKLLPLTSYEPLCVFHTHYWISSRSLSSQKTFFPGGRFEQQNGRVYSLPALPNDPYAKLLNSQFFFIKSGNLEKSLRRAPRAQAYLLQLFVRSFNCKFFITEE